MAKRVWLVAAACAAAMLVSGCGTSEKSTGAAGTTSAAKQGITTTSSKAAAPSTPLQNRRAGNGEIVQQNGLVGSGTLDIDNGNSADVAVVVTTGNPSNPQATIYVQGNSKATLSGIAGTYYVYLKSGKDWDQATLSFTRDKDFSKFDDPFDADSAWEISLQPTVGGNASTSDVPAF